MVELMPGLDLGCEIERGGIEAEEGIPAAESPTGE